MRLHKKDNTFEAAHLKELGTANDIKPEAEVEQIDALLKEVPAILEV
jgi:hypothetical protein